MRILSKRILRESWENHPDCKSQLIGWYQEVKQNDYQDVHQLLKHFPKCRAIGKNRYVFNIKGNKYRLVVKVNFNLNTVWIRFVGLHKDYDNINTLEI